MEREDREGLEEGDWYAEVAEDAEGAEKRGIGGRGEGVGGVLLGWCSGIDLG